MANPYYVAPLGGLDVGAKLSQVIEGGKQQQRLNEWKDTAPDIIKGGDPDAIAELMIKYPEMGDTIGNAAGYKQKQAQADLLMTAKNILINGEDAPSALGAHIQKAQSSGENVDKPMTTLGKTLQDPEHAKNWAKKFIALNSPAEYAAWSKTQPATGMGVAGVQEFEYLTAGLPEEDKAAAKRIKLGLSPRASENAVAKAIKANAIEVAKLQARLKLEPQVAGAVAAAKNEAVATVKAAGTVKSNEMAWNVYNNSMGNLSKAMQGTTTGPAVGFIPAVTTNQQIAEGAVAVLAPVLKQMFRAAGEGVFTDKDQELLMKMVPTRKDTPEARAAKIQGIDAVVRAKLGMVGESTVTPGDMPKPIAELSDADLEAQIKALQQGAQ